MPAVAKTRDESHALYCPEVDETSEQIVDAPASRGDVIVHHERAVHCSWPNLSNHWRHAYILNFRKAACIAEERALGFTHSHNDKVGMFSTEYWCCAASCEETLTWQQHCPHGPMMIGCALQVPLWRPFMSCASCCHSCII
jgi:hypothetical protein